MLHLATCIYAVQERRSLKWRIPVERLNSSNLVNAACEKSIYKFKISQQNKWGHTMIIVDNKAIGEKRNATVVKPL